MLQLDILTDGLEEPTETMESEEYNRKEENTHLFQEALALTRSSKEIKLCLSEVSDLIWNIY